MPAVGGMAAPELSGLSAKQIDSIALDYVNIREVDSFGNETRRRSTFRRERDDASEASLVVDIWFNSLVRQ